MPGRAGLSDSCALRHRRLDFGPGGRCAVSGMGALQSCAYGAEMNPESMVARGGLIGAAGWTASEARLPEG